MELEKKEKGKKPWRVMIAGGGTGGHIFPAIAVANALRARVSKIDILFVGAKGKMEMQKVPKAGYKIEGITIAGYDRGSLFKNMGLPFKLLIGFFQAMKVVGKFKPHLVLGVGGYSSYPVLRYAQLTGIPTFIHESNSIAGKSNRMLGNRAEKVFVASKGMEKYFSESKISFSGNPVRGPILSFGQILKSDAIRHFALSPEKPVLLVMGGSLGAKSINEAVHDNLQEIIRLGVQLIWQTGKSRSDKYITASEANGTGWAGEFIDQMELAYAASDYIVSRAGAMAIAELMVVGKPVILVPYPFAAEDHQTRNAKALENEGAAILIADQYIGQELVPKLMEWTRNKSAAQSMAQKIKSMEVLDADKFIAEQLYSFLKKKYNGVAKVARDKS